MQDSPSARYGGKPALLKFAFEVCISGLQQFLRAYYTDK
jgi:hypothetical protein